MKNRKFHLQYFSFYDLDGMARHLELMAAKGWMLEKMTTFGWHYRRMEPRRLRFSVTYQDTFSVFDPKDSEEQQTYQDLCRHSGWEVAASNGPLQAFYTEDEDAPPIETEPQMVLETMDRLSKKSQVASVLLLLLAFLNGGNLFWGLRRIPIELLASPLKLTVSICWILLGLYYALDLITYRVWRRKAKRAAAMGEFVHARGHSNLMRILWVTVVVLMLYVLLIDRLPGFRLLMLVLMVLMGVIFLVPSVVQQHLKKQGVSARANRRWTLLSNVATSLLVTATLSVLILGWAAIPSLHLQETDVEPPLTAADLTGMDDDRYVRRVHVDRSAFVYRFTCNEETPFDDDADLPCLSYEIADIRFEPVYGLCRDALVGKRVRLDPVGDVDAVYQNASDSTTYVLCWDTRLVTLHADWELTQAQLETAAAILAP